MQNELIPIIAFSAKPYKENPNAGEHEKVVEWWKMMAEKCKDLSPMVSFDLIVEPSDQVKKKDVADDALSVDVRSVTPTMKAITFPKNAASAHPANHLRTVAMMFTALSEKQSENGHPSPFLRLSLPDAENRVNIYILYINILTF